MTSLEPSSTTEAHRASLQRGPTVGNLVEVYGGLKQGDMLARRGTDELRAGTRVQARTANEAPARPPSKPEPR